MSQGARLVACGAKHRPSQPLQYEQGTNKKQTVPIIAPHDPHPDIPRKVGAIPTPPSPTPWRWRSWRGTSTKVVLKCASQELERRSPALSNTPMPLNTDTGPARSDLATSQGFPSLNCHSPPVAPTISDDVTTARFSNPPVVMTAHPTGTKRHHVITAPGDIGNRGLPCRLTDCLFNNSCKLDMTRGKTSSVAWVEKRKSRLHVRILQYGMGSKAGGGVSRVPVLW